MKISPVYLLTNLFILPSFIQTGDRESKVFIRAMSALASEINNMVFKPSIFKTSYRDNSIEKSQGCIIELKSSEIEYSILKDKKRNTCSGQIDHLRIDKDERGKGYGGALLLKSFFNIYDSCSTSGLKKGDVSLEASPFDQNRMSKTELKSWYNSFGLKPSSKNKDDMKIPLSKIGIIKETKFENLIFEEKLLNYRLKVQEESAWQKKFVNAAFSLWKSNRP